MIVTFYSYKGGTGRTMALANIAVLLARSGRHVLLVDFDLEAPGVWRYFNDFQPNLNSQPGLLDMLLKHVNQSGPSAVDWRDYVTTVRLGTEAIALMTSGKLDVEYPSRVLGFDWDALFRHHGGGQFFEDLRDAWNREYDFVLIDSRTGITDIGGICTIALPDMIVPVFVANNQNVDGIVDILRRAQLGRQKLAYDRPPALVLPVLSRFDSRTELEFVNEWLSLAANRLREFYSDWLPRHVDPRIILEWTKLPYVAYFGFGEKLAVILQGVTDPDSLGYAFNSVEKLIDTQLADVSSVLPSVAQESTYGSPLVRLEPPSDSWIAGIHLDGDLVGSAFLIDKDRLLTAAHVVSSILESKSGMNRLAVSFPKSTDEKLYPVAAVAMPEEPDRADVAVIHLKQPVRQSVGVPRIRLARPADLTGRQWWSFGFPDMDPIGGAANGTVGAALAYGSIRLDTQSRYPLGPGFSGAAVWSPEYAAVVGLVAAQNSRGDGIAITLDRAAQVMPEEQLRLLAHWAPEPAFSAQQRNAFINELALVFPSEAAARSMLQSIGFPIERIPRRESFATPLLYWTQVLTELENGIVDQGLWILAEEAADRYPGNAIFRHTVEGLA
jgi:cellulose biosynthesis protein BcsQ